MQVSINLMFFLSLVAIDYIMFRLLLECDLSHRVQQNAVWIASTMVSKILRCEFNEQSTPSLSTQIWFVLMKAIMDLWKMKALNCFSLNTRSWFKPFCVECHHALFSSKTCTDAPCGLHTSALEWRTHSFFINYDQ